MKILDSSYFADFLRGRESAKQYRLDHQHENFVLPSVGHYELYHGAVKEQRDPVLVDDHLPWVERLEYTREHALESARIRQELEANGLRIQHPDMMIAGVARTLGAPIVTSDAGFERIDGLEIDNHRELY
ncbi:PIN domain-containing protein [Natrarchaeobius chitinivorans]|uniref:Type II toxin-antitoxin system VapC family toxin n=1 Tax=Natrarchaeobius chitinivorans TaxID=1679083 RepID=A0A3N6LVR5_NATCH|nr:PIN domain-containing protein [Natrarchaeobius chitinivorans]RQG94588.1 type II toxin-antitoxin system VapC family toxin [Natrarchaeobius chitinivorans]